MLLDEQKAQKADYTALRRCLVVLLQSIGWNGDVKFLREFFEKHDTMETILNGLSHMNYVAEPLRTRLNELDDRLLPCLFTPDEGEPFVVLKHFKKKNTYKIYVGKLDSHLEISSYPSWGQALLVKDPKEQSTTLHDPQPLWFRKVLMRFKKHIIYGLFISFLLTLLSLSMPFFINLIFKKIATEQITVDFTMIFYGLLIYLGTSIVLTLIRSSVQTIISVRMGYLVINEVIRRILFLPSSYTETAPISSQLARVKDFESVKEFFSGPAMTALLDMPFVLILLGGLAWIDPILASIPLISIMAFTLMTISIKQVVKITNLTAAQTTKEMQEFLLDALTNLKSIRNLGYTEIWIKRFRDLSSRAIVASRESADVTGLIINLAQGITSVAGLLTMTVGVHRIFAGILQPSALMAAMLLTWRILAPMKTGFSVFSQIDRLRRSIEQIDRLMSIEIEKHDFTSRKSFSKIEGRLIVSQVSLRYGRDTNPVLLGVSFDAKPGETIAILGHGGAGKSTLIKLIMAMYAPQTGQVLIDGKNTRQIDPMELRRSIAYMPSNISFLSGTLRSQIQMINPHASSKSIRRALERVGLDSEIKSLEKGLNTRTNQDNLHILTASFMRRFYFALVLMKESGLWILDNPALDLESHHENEMKKIIEEHKGKSTILIAAQDPNYALLADRVLILNNGRSIGFASPSALESSKPPI